jgi:uncharacterized protein YjbJ (UPF0337 family)
MGTIRGYPNGRIVTMSATDKIKHKAEEVEGSAKEAVGKAEGNPRLEGEGKGKQVSGNLKQAGDKVKDAF